MRNRLERRWLTLRAAALCIVLVLLCGCLLPAFAEGPERTDSVPDQTWDEEIEDEPAWIPGQREKRWSNLLGMMPERNAADRGR